RLSTETIMPWSSYYGKSVVRLAGGNGIQKPQQATHRQQPHAKRISTSDGIAVQGVAIFLRSRLHERNIIGPMARLDFRSRCRLGWQELKPLFIEFGGEIEQNLDTLRSFQMEVSGRVFQVLGLDYNGRFTHK